MTMITAAKFDDFAASGIGTSQPQSTHRGLGTRIDKAHHFDGWHAINDQLRKFIFSLRWRTKAKTDLAGSHHRLYHAGVGMTQNHWPPRLNIVKIAVAIHIVEIRA